MKIFISEDNKQAIAEGNHSDIQELKELLYSSKIKIKSYQIKFEDVSQNSERKVKQYTNEGRKILSWSEFNHVRKSSNYEFVFDTVHDRFYFNDKPSKPSSKHFRGSKIIQFLAESSYPEATYDLARSLASDVQDCEASIRQAVKRLNDTVYPQIIQTIPNCGYVLNPDIDYAVYIEDV